jgi:hypothetical protein
MPPDLRTWADAGFGSELIPLCGPDHSCASPGKRPHLAGWQDVIITPATLAVWALTHTGNIGVRTRYFPAVDIDVESPAVAEACEEGVIATVGAAARRTRANTARRLLLFRLEGEPFEKATLRFTLPMGERAQVEILAAGQQVVVAGVHHTGAKIEWRDAPPTAPELTKMTVVQRDAVLAALRSRLVALGCGFETQGPREPRPTGSAPRRTAQDRAIAELALHRLAPDMPYDDWIGIGMALHDRWPDECGLALWNAWSARGEKYPGAREVERHWASFRAGGGVGFGTLIEMARRVTR